MVLLKVRVHLTTLLKVNQLLMVHLLLFPTLEDPKDKVRVKRYLTRVNKVKVKVSRVTLVNNLKEVNTDNKVSSRVKEGTEGTVSSRLCEIEFGADLGFATIFLAYAPPSGPPPGQQGQGQYGAPQQQQQYGAPQGGQPGAGGAMNDFNTILRTLQQGVQDQVRSPLSLL